MDKEVASRRKLHFKNFASGEADDGGFSELDVPVLAFQFQENFNFITTINTDQIVGDRTSVARDAFEVTESNKFENLLRLMIVASGLERCGSLVVYNGSISTTGSSSSSRSAWLTYVPAPPPSALGSSLTPPVDDRDKPQDSPPAQRRKSSLGAAIPDCLKYQSLRKTHLYVVFFIIIHLIHSMILILHC